MPVGTTARATIVVTVVSTGWNNAFGYKAVTKHDDGAYPQAPTRRLLPCSDRAMAPTGPYRPPALTCQTPHEQVQTLQPSRQAGGDTMKPFALNYVRPAAHPPVTIPYSYDPTRQWNVLPDGRPAISDAALLLATGTTTSTAGSKTHFDD